MIVMISGRWVRLPLEMLNDERITKTSAAVFAVIADKADGGSAELSAAEIAAAVGCSTKSVQRAVQALERAHYISVERVAGGSSEYKQLLLEPKRRNKSKQPEKPEQKPQEQESVMEQWEKYIAKEWTKSGT